MSLLTGYALKGAGMSKHTTNIGQLAADVGEQWEEGVGGGGWGTGDDDVL